MRIAINTFLTTSYEPLAALTTTVLQRYADKHGYDLIVEKIPDGNVDYIKTVTARKLLDEYDLVWAVENDILVTNMNIKIESFVDDEHDFFICKDINNVNGGSFIVKNSDVGKWWLDNTNKAQRNYKTEQNFWEYIGHEKIKYLPHPSINSIPYALYAPSYGRIGYVEGYVADMPTEEMGNWSPGNFVCHLPGKTLQERIDIFNGLKKFIIYE